MHEFYTKPKANGCLKLTFPMPQIFYVTTELLKEYLAIWGDGTKVYLSIAFPLPNKPSKETPPMISIFKSAQFIVFSLAVLSANYSFAQYSSEVIVYGSPTVVMPAPQLAFNSFAPVSQPLYPQQYSVSYASGISLHVSTHAPLYSQPTMQPSLMSQVPIQPYLAAQPLGYVETTGAIHSKDIGYMGPGDMRTHLWEHHASDLQANGISQAALMSMPMPTVQKWHNYFHGTEGAPSGY